MIYSIRSKLLEIEIPSIETRKLVLQLLKKKNLSPSLCIYKYKKKKKEQNNWRKGNEKISDAISMKVLAVCEEDSPYTDRLILLIAGDCVLHPVFTAYRAGEHCTGKQNLGEKKKKKSIYQHESMIFVGKRSNMPAVTIA